MSKHRLARWECVREMRKAGKHVREIADEVGMSVQHVNRILAKRPGTIPQRPGPRSRRLPAEVYDFIGWYRHDYSGVTTWRRLYNCQLAVKQVLGVKVSERTIKRIWRESDGLNFNYGTVRARVHAASQLGLREMIDEMAAVISPDNPEPNTVYDALRRTINQYIVGIFAVIYNKPARSPYQLKFTRVMSVIPQDRRLPEDTCQTVEIWVYRLACLYKITGGSKFLSYLNQYLPYKVKEAMQKPYEAAAQEIHTDEVWADHSDDDENSADD